MDHIGKLANYMVQSLRAHEAMAEFDRRLKAEGIDGDSPLTVEQSLRVTEIWKELTYANS